jgi:predicted ATPase
MKVWETNPFSNGSNWVRADFHLHTKADKEFKYAGQENDFVKDYVKALKAAEIRVATITNHNKFDLGEFKALRKKAKKEGICVLPGIELSVNDGANGVHTLVVFSDQWLVDGKNFINQFLATAFKGKVPADYEQENGRSSQSLISTLEELEGFHKEFFVVFAHVEAPSGLWKELDGGRLKELSDHPLIQKYCLGFQKVRTHDKADAKCRVKVMEWWGSNYPAEVEGCDAKDIAQIGRGKYAYLKVGDPSFESVKYALSDPAYRVAKEVPSVPHSHITAVRFEGGLLDGVRVPFSPHLNCLIGIRGSGKSAVLEAIRYVLGIPFGQVAQDVDYKEELIPYVLQSGGKVVVEAKDKHGQSYEISRIYKHSSDVYVDGNLQPGVLVRETVIWKPLYFGQKDLAAAGKGFGHDLVEKLVGDTLKPTRTEINNRVGTLEDKIEILQSLETDVEQKEEDEEELKDIKFRLDQFKKYGVKEKLDKQIEFDKDISYCAQVDELASDWSETLTDSIEGAEESFEELEDCKSKYNAELFKKYSTKLAELTKTIVDAHSVAMQVDKISEELDKLRQELEADKKELKGDFAKTERELVKALSDEGVTSIQPDEYVNLSKRKTALKKSIAELTKKTAKHKEKQNDVLTALAALNESWHKEFKLISSALDKINDTQSALKVEAKYKGDTAKFATRMEENFRGHHIRKETYKTISEKYTDFGEVYKSLDDAVKAAKSKADVFVEQFHENLFDLLSYQVPNIYAVTYHGKDLKSHSLGQRASAMMLFILSQKDCDLLLIDQPEDDLDGQSIYEEVVKLIREIKPEQQFIFATHNANFPVLGDAEMIGGCSFDEEKILVESGSIDCKTSQKKIVDIMEGGKEAFERRKSIYQQWEN